MDIDQGLAQPDSKPPKPPRDPNEPPKTKKAKTEQQEAQSALRNDWRLLGHLASKVNNSANKFLTDARVLLNELKQAPPELVILGIFHQTGHVV